DRQPVVQQRSIGASAVMIRCTIPPLAPLRERGWGGCFSIFIVAMVTTLAPQVRQQTRPTPQRVRHVMTEQLPDLRSKRRVLQFAPRFADFLQLLKRPPGA